MINIKDFKVGDKVHVIELTKASRHFKSLYNNSHGVVIKILSPTEVEKMTNGTNNNIGILAQLTPNKHTPIQTNFGVFSMFSDNQFVLTDQDNFIKE